MLLRRGLETVVLFTEQVTVDADGNWVTKPSSGGQVAQAVIQPLSGSESNDGAIVERLRMRLVGWGDDDLGAQAQVEWAGRRYAVDGEPRRYRGSARTAHVDYQLVRIPGKAC